jgi:hypothetical protein
MDDFESDPVVLCWQVINEIRKRAAAEEDKEQASSLAEVASFVPRWLFQYCNQHTTFCGRSDDFQSG